MAIKKKATPKYKLAKPKAIGKKARASAGPLDKRLTVVEVKALTEKEVNKKINDLICVFMKGNDITSRPIQYQSSWSTIMPVYVQCLKKVEKLKLKAHPMYWGIKKLVEVSQLEAALKLATKQDSITPLFHGIYIFLLWFTDKKK